MSIPCIYKTIEVKEGEAVPDSIEFGRLDYSLGSIHVCATSKEPWFEDNYDTLYSIRLETSIDNLFWYHYSDFYPYDSNDLSAIFNAYLSYNGNSFIRVIFKDVFPAGWVGKITVRVDFA